MCRKRRNGPHLLAAGCWRFVSGERAGDTAFDGGGALAMCLFCCEGVGEGAIDRGEGALDDALDNDWPLRRDTISMYTSRSPPTCRACFQAACASRTLPSEDSARAAQ